MGTIHGHCSHGFSKLVFDPVRTRTEKKKMTPENWGVTTDLNLKAPFETRKVLRNKI